MKYTSNTHEQKSDSLHTFSSPIPAIQSRVMKRLLLLIISIFMVFAAVQSTPVTQAKASAPCDMDCIEYIDPADGQCYRSCCPIEETCKIRCVIFPCDK